MQKTQILLGVNTPDLVASGLFDLKMSYEGLLGTVLFSMSTPVKLGWLDLLFQPWV